MDQISAWESFYRSNNRPWRGVSKIDDLPFPEGSHVLELGCGNGKTAIALTEMGLKVTGVDFSKSAIDMCSDIKGDVEFICSRADSLLCSDDSFDGALAFHVLEHLDDKELKDTVSELRRVVKGGGHILIKVFSRNDMRSEKGESIDEGTFVRGNGIRYHYYTEEELIDAFSPMGCASILTVDETTRFGTTRSRIFADFLNPID